MEPYNLDASLDANKVFLVKRSELENRIDPIFYGSDLTKFNKKFTSVKFSSVVSSFKSGVGAGKQDQAEGDEGIIQIRPTNIDNFGNLKFDKNVFLPYGFKGDKLKVDDVLFNNTNSQELVGKTAILLEEKELFYSNHITRIVVDKSQVLPLYIWIILNIYQENKIFYALCTNWNNQSGVGLELLKSLPIPLPPIEIQENIVSIIQNAYAQKQAKEAEAKELLASIDTYLLNELGITLPEEDTSLEARIFTTKFSEVVGGRLDPDYHQIFYRKFVDELVSINSKKLSELTSDIFQGIGKNEVEFSEYKLLKVKNIQKENVIDYSDVEYVRNVPINKVLQQGDIISPFIGEAIRQIKFSNFNNLESKFTVDNNTGVIRVFKNINNEFVCECLNSSIGKIQINRLIGGGGVPFLGSNNVKEIFIPVPPLEKQNEIAMHIASIRANAKALQQQAEQILAEAKQKVEQMILG